MELLSSCTDKTPSGHSHPSFDPHCSLLYLPLFISVSQVHIIYTYMYMYIMHVDLCMCNCAYVCVFVCVWFVYNMLVCFCMYLPLYICMYFWVCLCWYKYMHVCMYIHTSYVNVHAFVCMYSIVYMYLYVWFVHRSIMYACNVLNEWIICSWLTHLMRCRLTFAFFSPRDVELHCVSMATPQPLPRWWGKCTRVSPVGQSINQALQWPACVEVTSCWNWQWFLL